jgi:hypothetical protein
VVEKIIFNFNLTGKEQKTVSVQRPNLKCYGCHVLKLECTLIMPVADSDIRILYDISCSVLTNSLMESKEATFYSLRYALAPVSNVFFRGHLSNV